MRATIATISMTLACAALLAGEPLIPHRIEDMLLVGHEGTAGSTVARNLFYRHGYLYVAGEPGLQTVDASDPAHLVAAAEWPHSSPKMNGLAAKDDVLFAANWSPGEGLVLFDLANPADPARLGALATAAHTWELTIHGDLLHVGIDDGVTTGIATYAIGAPRAPEFLGFLSMGDRLVGNAARYGKHLYVSHQNWLRVYDAADPAAPRFVRELLMLGLCGEAQVRGEHLFLLTRAVMPGQQGGVHVFSLADPAAPEAIAFWEQAEPRDMHFQDDFLVVPASGSGIYTLDVGDPAHLRLLHHWFVNWPDTGHGGYPVTVTGSGTHVFIGTTGGNNPGCEDFESCAYYGARVYSVKIATAPPVIAAVLPDPDTAYVGSQYVRQLMLLGGEEPVAWSVVAGPPGLAVDVRGLVHGWTPAQAAEGATFTLTVRASNADGAAACSWRVTVNAPPNDLIARFPFETDAEGFALAGWKSGPYDPGGAAWQAAGGNQGGHLRAHGSGATNNLDTCNREGAILTRAVSTQGRAGIAIEFDVLAALAAPPGDSGAGSCSVLEGTSEDKLVLYYALEGTQGPWLRVLTIAEPDLPRTWTRMRADLSAAADDNARFVLRFQWQFNTAGDEGAIDNVRVLGAALGAFRRGDANRDGALDVADPIAALAYLFARGTLECDDAADANDDGTLDIADPIRTLGYLFAAAPPLPAPFGACGGDPTADDLGCASRRACR